MGNILYKLEKGETSILRLPTNELCLFDFDNILFDLENITLDDIDFLYPQENNESLIIEYKNLLKKFQKLQDPFLEFAYREGEINIINREYLYKGQKSLTYELLKLLPDEFDWYPKAPEDNYFRSIESNYEYEQKITLFLSAKEGFLPAIKLAKEKYDWKF